MQDRIVRQSYSQFARPSPVTNIRVTRANMQVKRANMRVKRAKRNMDTPPSRNYYVMGDTIPMSQWRTLLEQQDTHHTRYSKQIFDTYCRDCPLYQLIYGPNEVLVFTDSIHETVTRRVRILDRVLQLAIEIVRRRLPHVEDIPMVKRVFAAMTDETLEDHKLKLFFLLFLINWFPEVKDFVRSLYPADTPRAIQQRERFDALLPHLQQWCYAVTVSRYTVETIDGIMHTFYYRDFLPMFAAGPLDIGTPMYDDEMQAKKEHILKTQQMERQRRQNIRLRKMAMLTPHM